MATGADVKQEVAAIPSLSERAVFLSIHFNRFGNTRKVSTSRIEVGADKKRISVNKRLLDSPTLQQITSLDADVLRYVDSMCLPWERGVHVLPLTAVEKVVAKLKEFKEERDILVFKFTLEYPLMLEEARAPLGELFNEKDYLTEKEAAAEFDMRWTLLAFSTPDKLAEIDPAIFAAEREKVQNDQRRAFEDWRLLLRAGFAEVVNRLRESLVPGPDGTTRKLTDASVERLKSFLETFQFKNISDDKELAEITEEMRGLMDGIDVESLRESESLKVAVGAVLKQAADSIEVVTGSAVRSFDFSE